MVVFVVDHSVLSGGDSLYLVVGFDTVQVADAADTAVGEVRRVADLESDLFLILKLTPRIFGDEVEAVHVDDLAVLCFRVVAVGDVDDVPSDVFFDDEPRSSAQSQSLALPDGVEPIAVVFAQHLAGFQFDDLSGPFTQVAFDEIVVVDFA